MFVLYLSWPVLPSLINSVHYRDSKKELFTKEKEREKYLEIQVHREEYGVQIQMQASLIRCGLLWSQEFTEKQDQN